MGALQPPAGNCTSVPRKLDPQQQTLQHLCQYPGILHLRNPGRKFPKSVGNPLLLHHVYRKSAHGFGISEPFLDRKGPAPAAKKSAVLRNRPAVCSRRCDWHVYHKSFPDFCNIMLLCHSVCCVSGDSQKVSRCPLRIITISCKKVARRRLRRAFSSLISSQCVNGI